MKISLTKSQKKNNNSRSRERLTTSLDIRRRFLASEETIHLCWHSFHSKLEDFRRK